MCVAPVLFTGSCCSTSASIQVRIYQVGPGAQTQGKAMYTHEGPVLNVCWSKVRCLSISSRSRLSHFYQDGTKVLSGGADNAARMFDLNTGQTQQVAQHDAPIKAVRWIETPQGGILATGSWDKTLKASSLVPHVL